MVKNDIGSLIRRSNERTRKSFTPPPVKKIQIDRNLSDFFQTGRTRQIDKSNEAIKQVFVKPIPLDPQVSKFFNQDIKNSLDKSNSEIAKAFTSPEFKKFGKDLETAGKEGLKDFRQIMTGPSNLLNAFSKGLQNPYLLPAIAIVGGIVVFQLVIRNK
jgi:hypothetical protein